jgi:cytochrome c5
MKETAFTMTKVGAALLVASGLVATVLHGTRAKADDKSVATAGITSSVAADPGGKIAKGGAQLWAENCARCHNMRSPSSYSAAEWEVVMFHMRVRANLTPEEHQKILEFLKSAK